MTARKVLLTVLEGITDMFYEILSINLADNSQLTPIVIGLAVVVVVCLIVVLTILRIKDKRKEKMDENIDTAWHAEQVVNRTDILARKGTGEKKVKQIKRETRDPRKKAEEEAAAKNTLIGGRSEAQ